MDEDLRSGYAAIRGARTTACRAAAVPGFVGRVWKYGIPSSNMGRGKSGGFRLLGFYDAQTNTLFPFCLYTHQQYEKQPPPQDIKTWLRNLAQELASRQPGLFEDNPEHTA